MLDEIVKIWPAAQDVKQSSIALLGGNDIYSKRYCHTQEFQSKLAYLSLFASRSLWSNLLISSKVNMQNVAIAQFSKTSSGGGESFAAVVMKHSDERFKHQSMYIYPYVIEKTDETNTNYIAPIVSVSSGGFKGQTVTGKSAKQ